MSFEPRFNPGSPYDVLGVQPNDPEGVIKKAYLVLLRTWHPDKCAPSGATEQRKVICTQNQQSVQSSWEFIKDGRVGSSDDLNKRDARRMEYNKRAIVEGMKTIPDPNESKPTERQEAPRPRQNHRRKKPQTIITLERNIERYENNLTALRNKRIRLKNKMKEANVLGKAKYYSSLTNNASEIADIVYILNIAYEELFIEQKKAYGKNFR
jgi:hypothetical protein